jgi:hypothetical protein
MNRQSYNSNGFWNGATVSNQWPEFQFAALVAICASLSVSMTIYWAQL